MTRYVLVEDGTDKILKDVEGDREFRGGTPPDLPGKPFRWLPLIISNPPVNHTTEIKTGPVDVLTTTNVTREWVVRGKTPTELDDADNKDVEEWLINMGPLLKVLDSGAFIPGSKYTIAQIKNIFKVNK